MRQRVENVTRAPHRGLRPGLRGRPGHAGLEARVNSVSRVLVRAIVRSSFGSVDSATNGHTVGNGSISFEARHGGPPLEGVAPRAGRG